MSKNIAIITTSASALKGSATGLWLEELSSPYYAFKQAGYTVTVASIAGGNIPLDATSLSGDFLTESAAKFLKDGENMIPPPPPTPPASSLPLKNILVH